MTISSVDSISTGDLRGMEMKKRAANKLLE